jgi:hypothetical protein
MEETAEVMYRFTSNVVEHKIKRDFALVTK